QDKPGEITINTGPISFTIPRPFSGLGTCKVGDKIVLRGDGGPSLVDAHGIQWHSRFDATAEVVVEQQGPAQGTGRASGWYQTQEKRAAPFCRFVTRITACAGSPVIKFDHATIFADDMRKHAVAELSFKFPLPNTLRYTSGSETGKFDDAVRSIWFA